MFVHVNSYIHIYLPISYVCFCHIYMLYNFTHIFIILRTYQFQFKYFDLEHTQNITFFTSFTPLTCPYTWSTGISKYPMDCPECRSHASTRFAPASVIRFATSLAAMDSRPWVYSPTPPQPPSVSQACSAAVAAVWHIPAVHSFLPSATLSAELDELIITISRKFPNI